MSDLVLEGKVIDESIEKILIDVKKSLNDGRFSYIEVNKDGRNVRCSCPFHKNGRERKPSMYILNTFDDKVTYGTAHCFTCGYHASLPQFISDCFDEDSQFGVNWLLERYGDIWVEKDLHLESINLSQNNDKKYMSESVLKQFNYKHPYMYTRHLTDDVIEDFEVGYDKNSDMITFPVRDLNGKLLFITRRSTQGKKFLIDSNVDKPIYLLNYAREYDVNKIYICESQINALTLHTWGYFGVATFGSGITEYQLNILEHCGINNFVICYDNDEAGKKGSKIIRNYFKHKPFFVSNFVPPLGKDINDMTKQEFEYCLHNSKSASGDIVI